MTCALAHLCKYTFVVYFHFPLLEYKRRLPLPVLCFYLNSATSGEFPCLILKSVTGVFCQELFTLLIKQRLLIPVSSVNKFIAIIMKEYFILLSDRNINRIICSRAIFRTLMVSS